MDRPYHHGDLKNALVAAGIACLEQDGLAALSLRGIAARAGVSHTAPKNHFGSLKGLLTAIATEGWHRHASAMRGHLPANAPPRDRLIAIAEGYVGFALSNPALYQLMLSPLHCELDDPAYQIAASASYGVLATVTADLIRAGLMAQTDPLAAETLLWSLVHGYVLLHQGGMLGHGDQPPPPIAALLPRPPA